MRFLNGLIRLLAVVLLLAVALALLASWLFGWDLPARMEAFRLTAPLGWRLLAGAGCLLTAAAAVAPLLPRRKKRGDGYLVQRFDADSVCVSRGAVEAIAARCIREHKELEGAKITVTDGEAGLTVEASCKLVSGASLSQSVEHAGGKGHPLPRGPGAGATPRRGPRGDFRRNAGRDSGRDARREERCAGARRG